jgi:CubicO group peptidase (beta-lactamase class C family)
MLGALALKGKILMQFFALLFSIAVLIAPAGGKESPAAPARVQALADAFVESELAPGIAIGVLDESRRIRTYSAGTLEVGGGRPVTKDTIFEIGSITKVFTATLAHMLEQQGELSLSDPVTVHLPDEIDVKAVAGNEILLWHLATHTSGLPRVPTEMNSGKSYYPFSLDQLYEFLVNWEPNRAPGESYLYSNLGFGLLGLAVELNQNASFEELVRRHILSRLNMRSTGCMYEGGLAERVATGHQDNRPVSARFWTRPTAGAGGLKSSVKDLMLFAKANLATSNTQLHRSIRACQISRIGKSRGRVGLAWNVSVESSERIISHDGATRGFRSFIAFMPDRGHAVVVLANSTHEVATLARHILAPDVIGIEQLPPLSIPTYRPRRPIDLDQYVGSYRSASDERFAVENRNGELFARLNKQSFFSYRPIGENLFLFNKFNARLRFEHDTDGRVTTLILEQNGSKTTYHR